MTYRSLATIALTLLAGCASDPPPPEGDAVEPGVGIGEARLGMRYAELTAALGPPEGAFVNQRVGFARYPALGLEVVLTSPDADAVVDDALVVGVGVSEGADVHGPVLPGDARAEVEAALGPAPATAESLAYYPEGLSVEYDGDRVLRVGVVPPWESRPDVPEMREARP